MKTHENIKNHNKKHEKITLNIKNLRTLIKKIIKNHKRIIKKHKENNKMIFTTNFKPKKHKGNI